MGRFYRCVETVATGFDFRHRDIVQPADLAAPYGGRIGSISGPDLFRWEYAHFSVGYGFGRLSASALHENI